jgi:hypothetical protein
MKYIFIPVETVEIVEFVFVQGSFVVVALAKHPFDCIVVGLVAFCIDTDIVVVVAAAVAAVVVVVAVAAVVDTIVVVAVVVVVVDHNFVVAALEQNVVVVVDRHDSDCNIVGFDFDPFEAAVEVVVAETFDVLGLLRDQEDAPVAVGVRLERQDWPQT